MATEPTPGVQSWDFDELVAADQQASPQRTLVEEPPAGRAEAADVDEVEPVAAEPLAEPVAAEPPAPEPPVTVAAERTVAAEQPVAEPVAAEPDTDPFAGLLTPVSPVDGQPTGAPAMLPDARHGRFVDSPLRTLGALAAVSTARSVAAVGVAVGLVTGVTAAVLLDDSPSVSLKNVAPPAGAVARAPADQAAAGQGDDSLAASQGTDLQAAQPGGQPAQSTGRQSTGQTNGQTNGQSTGQSTGQSAAGTATDRRTITGSFTLWAGQPQKNACAAHPQVPDIVAGAKVVVSDGAGKVLASTTLGRGSVEATQRGCVFPFEAAGLPKAERYQVKVGRQSALVFPAVDLAASGWRVLLNLGVPDAPVGTG